MTKSVTERELVLGILLSVTRDGEYSHIALRNVLSKYQYLEKKERAFITRVSEGTLERMMELDYILNQFSKVKVSKMKPVIRNIVRSAVYQMKYMDSVPNSAAVNEAVKLTVKKGFSGLKGFVNGLLRNIDRNLDQVCYPKEGTREYFSVKYSMPEWILAQWEVQYGKEVMEKMLSYHLQELPTVIRCVKGKTDKAALTAELEEAGVTVTSHPYLETALCISGYDYLEALPSFREGAFQVQDFSSMLAVEIADPKEGSVIYDVCAAPGGKALYLAEKLAGTGSVEARDLTSYKTDMIKANIERASLVNIRAVCKDASVPDPEEFETADLIMADLPCSGLGVLGKKTDLKYKMKPETQKELVALQRKILDVSAGYVKPGGVLIYSTCTVNKEENESNVRWFLEKQTAFALESIEPYLCEALEDSIIDGGMIQLLPGVHKCDGFFIAKFRKGSHG